jgi:hypothetical protein
MEPNVIEQGTLRNLEVITSRFGEVWQTSPELVTVVGLLTAGVGLLIVVVFVLNSNIRKLQKTVTDLRTQDPIADRLVQLTQKDTSQSNSAMEELRFLLATEAVKRFKAARSTPHHYPLWDKLNPQLDELVLDIAKDVADDNDLDVKSEIAAAVAEESISRLQRARTDEKHPLRQPLFDVIDSMIVSKANELGDSEHAQYLLQDKLNEELAQEVLERFRSAKLNRDRDDLWDRADPIFDKLILGTAETLTVRDVTPVLRPLLVNWATELVRRRSADLPRAVEGLIVKLIAQVLASEQDAIRSQVKEMLLSAARQRAEKTIEPPRH